VFVQKGSMSADDVYTSWQSWKAYASNFDAYNTIVNMGKLYNKLIISDWIIQPVQ